MEIHPWLKFEHQVEVNTEQLDSFCQNNSIQKIDLIHMDVQGAELMVLNGAEKMIPKIKMIWMEVENLKLYKDQPLKTDVESFMATHGFTKIKDTVSSIAGDQLWVNLSYFPRKRFTHNVWRLVEPLFTKKKKKVELSDAAFVKKSFAQCGEDLIVDYIFQAKGLKTYSHLDIGAHHPYKVNNTYLSYTKGGRGINVEPNPNLFSLFNETRKEDINLNVGVAEISGELEYFMVNDPALNTFSKDELLHIQEKGYKLVNTIKVKVHTINEIIQNYFRDEAPDVLFVDVEGLDLEIIRSLDFQKYRPKVICIETISFETDGSGVKNDNLIQFILSKDYQLYADTNINSIFVLKDFWHQ
jgi:FkbM family methyltransferase